ncbi:Sensor histidine kinase TmoS [Anatilimnocola aggregata]|uniref:histidine kinase n=1 Tax=Anatilimnocola aggregata TaxID=2528021 RepID=A0A517YMY4_9BACT|nr:PAS domain S-box protein [Anatilimnocola aggregata]QDU31571.1 Sensor histidine kinase TmoS [Anatilimnocola aggregata]
MHPDSAQVPRWPAVGTDQPTAVDHDQVLAEVFRRSPSFMAVLRGPDHVFELANDAYRSLVGQRQLIGRAVRDAFPELAGQGYFELLDRVYATGEVFSGTNLQAFLHQRDDAQPVEIRLDLVYQPLRDERGQVTGIFAHGVDLTQHHLAEQSRRQLVNEIAQQANVYETTLSSISDFAYTFNRAGRFLYANKPLADLLAMRPAEIVGKNFFDLNYPPELAAKLQQQIEQVFATGEGLADETAFTGAAGESGYFEYIFRPVFDLDGRVVVVAGSTRDITQRKLAEEPLRASEARFRAIFDQAAVGMVEFDTFGVVTRTNETFCRIVGRNTSEVVGVTSAHYSHPEDVRIGIEAIRQIAEKTAHRASFEKRYIRSDGTIVWARATLSPLFDASGQLLRLMGIVEDISEQKSAEDRLRFLMHLSDTVRPLINPDEIMATSAQLLGEFLDVDRCAYAEIEADQDAMLLAGNFTRGTKSLVGRMRFSDFGAEAIRLMQGNQPYVVYDIDSHVPTVDVAAYRAAEIQAVICIPLHKAGKFVAAMAVHQTQPRVWTNDEIQIVQAVATRCWESIERARVTRHYRDSEQRYRTFVDTVSSVVWLTDPDGNMVGENPSWCGFTGQSWEGCRGFGWLSAIHPDDQQRTSRIWREAIVTRQMYECEYRLRRHDGVYRYVIARGAPVLLADGTVKEWVGNCTDNHDQRMLVEQNQRLLESERAARSEAERTGRMKDEFLATLSHELRTPLSAILGWAQLLQHADIAGSEAKEGLATIERNARIQAQLIDDLLDMSRIISGKIRLDVQTVDLPTVITAAINTVRHSAEAKRIVVRTILDSHAGPIAGDPHRLQQIVWNLLSNSIKFTPAAGKIEVILRRVDSHVEISVADSGVGIQPEFVPHVFERFRQADASISRSFSGLGLGLAIVKQLVELHGGSIHVASEGEGRGSTFTVLLPVSLTLSRDVQPLQPADRARTPSAAVKSQAAWVQPNLQGVKVLLVDDERDARELARRILTDCQAEVLLAPSGEAALQLLGTATPDVIVSDIGMPELDGYELMRRVRAQGITMPAAALTAFARAEDRTQALLAGFQTHITKPVDPRELMATVATLVGRTGNK